MVIEIKITDTIEFFHMDALSAVPIRINTDLHPLKFASALYCIVANHLSNRRQKSTVKVLFWNFVCAMVKPTISEQAIQLRFNRRVHNPLMISVGFVEHTASKP